MTSGYSMQPAFLIEEAHLNPGHKRIFKLIVPPGILHELMCLSAHEVHRSASLSEFTLPWPTLIVTCRSRTTADKARKQSLPGNKLENLDADVWNGTEDEFNRICLSAELWFVSNKLVMLPPWSKGGIDPSVPNHRTFNQSLKWLLSPPLAPAYWPLFASAAA